MIKHKTLVYYFLLPLALATLLFVAPKQRLLARIAKQKGVGGAALALVKLTQLGLPFYPYWSLSSILFAIGYLSFLMYWCFTSLPDISVDSEFPRYGFLALCHFALLPFLSLKNSPLLWIGCNYSDLIALHILYAIGGIAMSAMHGGLYLNEWVTSDVMEIAFGPEMPFGNDPTIGVAALGIMGLVFLTSLPSFRWFFYRVFKLVHVASMPCILITLYIHAPKSLPFLLPGMLMFFVDGIARLIPLLTPLNYTALESHNGVTRVKVGLPMTLAQKPKPGQWFLIYSPLYGLHPLSSIDCTDTSVSFAVCQKTRLAQSIAKSSVTSIDGPYGNSFDSILNAENGGILLIAGGIGITPLISIALSPTVSPSNVAFVYVARTKKMVDAFKSELDLMTEKGVNVQVYITKDSLSDCCVESSDSQSSSDSHNDLPFSDIEERSRAISKELDLTETKRKPSLDSLCSLGRPDMAQLVRDWSKKHEASRNVAIGVCGPQTMIRQVRGIARVSSTSTQLIHCFSETFC